MNKNKAIKNVISNFIYIILYNFISLIINSILITNLGSDLNGLNITISQALNLLLIFESGIIFLSTYSLYKPIKEQDSEKIQSILYTIQIKLKKISWYSIIFGGSIVILYTFSIKTSSTSLEVVIIMLVGILSTFINLYFTSKYKPAFLANQDDYKITTINIAITILNGLISIFVLNLFNNLLIFRLISLLFSIISVLSIKLIFKRNYPNYSFSKTNLIQFNGSNDYLTSKIMNFFYYSFPSLFLSSFFGTEITSVFNIYYVISLLGSNIVLSFTSGFENSFGVKINTTKDSIKDDFEFFESITFFIVIIVFSVLVSSMIPFIRIYSKEFDQLNYLNIDFLIFVNLTSIFQLFHIPSGIIINLNGKFKIIKRIQLFALLTLVSTTFLFTYFFGLLGFLFSKLLTNFFIAFIEIYYLRTYILKSNFLKSFLKILISIILISSVFFIVNLSGNIFIVETYFDFIIILVIITLLSLFLSLPMIFFVPGLKHKLIKFFERLRASH